MLSTVKPSLPTTGIFAQTAPLTCVRTEVTLQRLAAEYDDDDVETSQLLVVPSAVSASDGFIVTRAVRELISDGPTRGTRGRVGSVVRL